MSAAWRPTRWSATQRLPVQEAPTAAWQSPCGSNGASAVSLPAFSLCCRQKQNDCQISVSTRHFAASVTLGVSLCENIADPSSTDFLGRVRAAAVQSRFSMGWPVCLETSLLGAWTQRCWKQPDKGGRRGSRRGRFPEAKLVLGGGWEEEVVLFCFLRKHLYSQDKERCLL